METPRYRIGNDLTVFWAISNRDGSPFNMNGKEVRLFVTNERGREEVKVKLTKLDGDTINNVIRWDYKGDKQRVLGPYKLTVEISDSGDHREITKDYCEAFTLVSRSDMESSEGDANISTGGDLILSSKLDIYRFEAVDVDVADIKVQVNDIREDIGELSEMISSDSKRISAAEESIDDIDNRVKQVEDAIAEGGVGGGSGTPSESYWYLDESDGRLHVDHDIFVHGNAIITGDTASGGKPGNTPGVQGDGDKHYVHIQSTASDVWVIEHGLNKYPSVTVVDSAGTLVIGDIKYLDIKRVEVKFMAAFSGRAYLN